MVDPQNELSTKVAVSLITEVFKTCFSGFREAEQWIKNKSKEYDPLGRAGRTYAERLEERYDFMRIFGMTKPVPLRNIYTRVNLLEKITARHRASVKELEEFFDRDLRSFGNKRDTKDGITVVNKLQKFIVLGKPGAGKTTFLKYILLQALDGNLIEQRIPIFIGLKDWSDTEYSLMEYIVEQFDICSFPDADLFVERMLVKGNCLLLLDGLDEVTQDVEKIISQIRNFTDKYNKNQFIISCRIAAYNYYFERFTDVEIADFNDRQIAAFILNWFRDDTRKGKLCWRKISQTKTIKELATNPLLLTLICISFDETMDFPANRAELYKEALDALLKKWDASRSIKRGEIYKHLSTRRKESMFSRIAATTFENDQYFLSTRLLEKQIAAYIENLPEAQQETLILDSEAILKEIEAQHGIFVERAKGIYSFSHLTFQEYFTARYIVDNASSGTMQRLVNQHLTDDKWREVFLLTAGMLDEADHFILTIQEGINQFIVENLNTYLREIQVNIIKPTCLYSLQASTALVIYYIIAIGAKTTTQEVSLARGFAGMLDLGLRNSIKVKPDVALEKTFYQEKVIDLMDRAGNTLIDSLKVYLKMNQLILDCLNTECYVSKSTRQKVHDSLFVLLDEVK